MISKKTNKSDLENKRVLFFEIGILTVLALLLVAFEWSSVDKPAGITGVPVDDFAIQVETVVRTVQQQQQKTEYRPFIPKIIIVDKDPVIPGPEINLWTEGNIGKFKPLENPEEKNVTDTVPVYFAEVMPKFMGKDLDEFRIYIQSIAVYPVQALQNEIQGKVFVQFIVDQDGKITNVSIQGSAHQLLTRATMEALNKAPDWQPGQQNGKPVRVIMNMPVTFKIQ